jgi:hypothetical protein
VELWGEEPAAERTQTVSVGGGGSAERRRRVLAAGVVAAVVLLGGLALTSGGDSGEQPEERDNSQRTALKRTTTTRPRPTTTTMRPTTTTATSAPVAPGPVFGEPVGASILLLRYESAQSVLLDLDTGVVTILQIDANSVDAVPVRGGVVVVANDTAQLVRLPEPGVAPAAGAPVLPPPSTLGVADRVMASGSPDTVWLLHTKGPEDGGGVTGQLVDLEGRPLLAAVDAPTSYPMGANRDGLVFGAGGRIYLATPQGVRELGVGELLDVDGDRLVVLTCSSAAVCSPEILDVASSRRLPLPAMPNPREFGSSFALSETGAVAVLRYDDGGGLSLHDPEGGLEGSMPGITPMSQPEWLPGDLGVVVADAGGFLRVFATGGALDFERIQALQGRRSDVVYVIPH